MTSYKRLLFLFIAAFTVMGAALFVACGGDDNTSSSAASDGAIKVSGETGSDQAFVNDICKATDRFTKEMNKVSAGPTAADPSKAMEQVFKSMSGPMSTFASDFAKAKPPKDLVQWHADTAKQLGVVAKALKDGKFDDPAIASLGDSPIADMPKDAEARLSKLAANADGCKGTAVFPK